MKTKLFISLSLFISSLAIGQTNVIQVRKVTYDTSFYTKTVYDTTIEIKGDSVSIFPYFNQDKTGYWKGNVFFDEDSLHIFTKFIKTRKTKISRKKPESFWKKINRKKRKNKCNVYSIAYKFIEIINSYEIKEITNTHFQITNNSKSETLKNDSLIIFSDTINGDNQVYRKYYFVSDFDSILLASTKDDFEICEGSDRQSWCQFTSLVRELDQHYRINNAYGFYKYSGKINDKRCNMFLSFESYLIRKAIIIEDNKARFYCDFDISTDSIFVYNSPFGEIHTGTANRKRNKIRFKNSRKSYVFYKKKHSQYNYYNYPVAN